MNMQMIWKPGVLGIKTPSFWLINWWSSWIISPLICWFSAVYYYYYFWETKIHHSVVLVTLFFSLSSVWLLCVFYFLIHEYVVLHMDLHVYIKQSNINGICACVFNVVSSLLFVLEVPEFVAIFKYFCLPLLWGFP